MYNFLVKTKRNNNKQIKKKRKICDMIQFLCTDYRVKRTLVIDKKKLHFAGTWFDITSNQSIK